MVVREELGMKKNKGGKKNKEKGEERRDEEKH